ncbi:MAG: alpha/beta hydrolase [Actinomycetota bacterium]
MSATIIPIEDLADVGEPTGPPSRFLLAREYDVAAQPLRLALNTGRLLRAPKGRGRRAILIPGWRAPEASIQPLLQFLRRRGHDARTWGFGINFGNVEMQRDRMVESVRATVERVGEPINLIGWSLGGVIAREVARSMPDDVHRLVTYGTPVLGGPTHTVGAADAGPEECARITQLQEHLDATDPIRVPLTAIFTRRDGAVDWRACIDRSSLDVTMVEVGSGHVALGLDPDVWVTVAKALAE